MDRSQELALIESIAKIANTMDEDRIAQVPVHKAKIRTAFNPTGEKTRPRLKRPVWFNGAPINPVFLTNEEIELCNQLTPGRYNERQWAVIEHTDNPDKPIEVRVQDAAVEDRMTLYKNAPSFAALCKAILDEAGALVAA
jgi:hypothetical protein